MSDSPEAALTTELVERLLTQREPEEGIAVLAAAGLLNAGGLSALLDRGMGLARSNPGQARRLVVLCEAAASRAQTPEILPRAIYARAQTHALNGEFHTALQLIEAAQAAYASLGDQRMAVRTNLGRIHVLNELGQHADALEAAQMILETAAREGWTDPMAREMKAVALSNKGICLETTGQYSQALDAYGQAEAEFAALGQNERIGDVSSNRGIVLVHLGRAREALAAFEQAAKIQEEAGLTLLLAQTTSNIGDAYLALGVYSQALEAYQRARGWFEQLDARASFGILLRKTADAYLALNLYPEAVSLYREADEVLRPAGMADHHARALAGLGAASLALRRLSDAGLALREAEDLFQAAGNLPMQASVLLQLSALQEADNDPSGALGLAEAAYALVDGASYQLQRLYACLRLVDLQIGAPEKAQPYLSEAERLAQAFDLPLIRFHVESRMGRLRLREHHLEEAQRHLDAAAQIAESLRGSLAHEMVRSAFFQDKTALYQDLVRLHLESSAPGSLQLAFQAAEKAKSRTLLDLTRGVRPAAASKDPDDAHQQRVDQLQTDLWAVYNRWLDISGETDAAQALRARAQELEEKLSRLRLEGGRDSALGDPFLAALSLDELHALLPKDAVLLSYYLLEEEIIAFLVYEGSLQVVRGLAQRQVVVELLQRLAVQWDRFRVGELFAERHAAALERSVQRVLSGLHQALIAPLARFLPDDQTIHKLVVVPHDVLHQVPFHALFDGRRYLVDAYEVRYALSTALYGLALKEEDVHLTQGLAAGIVDSSIPAAEIEVQTVAAQVEASGARCTAYVGQQAQRNMFLEQAPRVQLVHLACHGLFRADNPIFSSLKFADGWLDAADILNLRLDSAIVALSACESARAHVLGGDEVIGLPRAFLGAGAQGVLVSLWLVQDEAARTLMQAWYSAWLPAGDRATALRQAQLQVKQERSHPFYWAPFIYIGR